MKSKPSNAGFTLIETLIAIVILSIGLAGMIPVLAHSVRGNFFGDMTTQAATFSQDKLEELRRALFSALAPGTDTPAAGLTRTWTVDPGGGGSSCNQCSADVVGIEVSTQWSDRHGVTHVATFFSMRANL
jgi:prepilin-type N-terminal cleavage/methylation domain-containing protein